MLTIRNGKSFEKQKTISVYLITGDIIYSFLSFFLKRLYRRINKTTNLKRSTCIKAVHKSEPKNRDYDVNMKIVVKNEYINPFLFAKLC